MSRYCVDCGKAGNACICQWIEKIDARTELWILQHPSEVSRPLGTARILTLSLPNARLWVGEDFSRHEEINNLLADPERHAAVLYPDGQAVPLSRRAAQNTPPTLTTLILLDGTWKKAYKIWRLSANLQALPCVCLDDVPAGNYRIRKSPKQSGLSTVEAAFHALSQLEGESRRFLPLVTAFEKMIDFQISQMPPGLFERHYGKQP